MTTKTIAKLTPAVRLIGVFLVITGFGLARGQSAQTQASAPSPRPDPPSLSNAPGQLTDSANPDEYVISPEDILAVYVYDVPELSRDYTVSTGGTIIVPLLTKPVHAASLSLNQFSRNLEQSFREPGVLSNPRVTVDVRQSRRSVVTVEGAVKTPQAVPVIGRTRLLAV